jgi:E3 ubiquitin-protein ligase NEDD4
MAANGKLTLSFLLATESPHRDEVPSNSFAELRISGPSSRGSSLPPQISQASFNSNPSRGNLSAHEESARSTLPASSSTLLRSVRPTTAPNSLTVPGAMNAQSSSLSHSQDPSPRPSTAGQNARREDMFIDASGNILPSGWERRLDNRSRPYYINRETRESTWHSPALATVPTSAPAPVPQTVPTQAISNVNANSGPYTDISLPLGWEERRTEEGQQIIL